MWITSGKSFCLLTNDLTYDDRVFYNVLMRLFSYLLLFLTILSHPISSSAHVTGAFFEKEVGNFIVDIGYDPEIIVARESSAFSFDLLDKTNRDPQEFTSIWVKIDKGEQTTLATGIARQSLGITTLLYTFPEAGEYELNVRYQSGDDSIAEASFPIVVEEGEGGSLFGKFSSQIIVGFSLISTIGAFILGTILSKRRKIENKD
jgi:hypothetical protein